MTQSREHATYGTLHGGDIILGDDNKEWGVEYVARTYAQSPGGQPVTRFTVSLVRHGQRVVGTPIEWTPVIVVHRADTAIEAGAYQALADAGLNPEVVAETWRPYWQES